jgi:nucleotide-binding universal stress UspA family protein
MAIRRILVGLDGSSHAQRALEWAIDLARAVDATIVAVHALGLLDQLGPDRVPTGTHRGEIVAEFETSWCAALDHAGLGNERLVRDGTPAEVLLAVAADADVDLVVVGTRGAGRSQPQLLGSTSHRVAEGSTRPVVIVPSGSTAGSVDAEGGRGGA